MGLAVNGDFLVFLFVMALVSILAMNVAKHFIEIQEREIRKKYEVIDETKDSKKE